MLKKRGNNAFITLEPQVTLLVSASYYLRNR